MRLFLSFLSCKTKSQDWVIKFNFIGAENAFFSSFIGERAGGGNLGSVFTSCTPSPPQGRNCGQLGSTSPPPYLARGGRGLKRTRLVIQKCVQRWQKSKFSCPKGRPLPLNPIPYPPLTKPVAPLPHLPKFQFFFDIFFTRFVSVIKIMFQRLCFFC